MQIAAVNLRKLEGYQVTAEDIAALKSAIDATTAAENQRNMLAKQSSSATKALEQGFKNTFKMLTSLDRLLKKQVKDETFLASYAALSVVHVYPRRQAARKTQSAPQTQPVDENQEAPATNIHLLLSPLTYILQQLNNVIVCQSVITRLCEPGYFLGNI